MRMATQSRGKFLKKRGRPSKCYDIMKYIILYMAIHGQKSLDELNKEIYNFINKFIRTDHKTVRKYLKNLCNIQIEAKPLPWTIKITPLIVTKWRGKQILHIYSEYPMKETVTILWTLTQGILILLLQRFLFPTQSLPLLILSTFLIVVSIITVPFRWLYTRVVSQYYGLDKDVIVKAKLIVKTKKKITLTKKFKQYTSLSKVKKYFLNRAFLKTLDKECLHYERFPIFINGVQICEEKISLYELGEEIIELDLGTEMLVENALKELRSIIEDVDKLSKIIMDDEMVRKKYEALQNRKNTSLYKYFGEEKYEITYHDKYYKDMVVMITVREFGINLKKLSEKLKISFSVLLEAANKLVSSHSVNNDLRLIRWREDLNDEFYLNKIAVQVEIKKEGRPLPYEVKNFLSIKLVQRILETMKKSEEHYISEEMIRKILDEELGEPLNLEMAPNSTNIKR